MVFTLLLALAAALIILYLLGFGQFLHLSVSFHLGGLKLVLVAVLILVLLALISRGGTLIRT